MANLRMVLRCLAARGGEWSWRSTSNPELEGAACGQRQLPTVYRRMKTPNPLPEIGRNVTLRRLRIEDLRPFQAYRHDPEVGRLQGWTPEPDEAAEEFLAAMSRVTPFVPGKWFQLGIAEKASDLLIGDIGICLSQDQSESEIGISLRGESQGRGLASEALSMAIALIFNHTSSGSVKAITDQRNRAAIKLLERTGMRAISTEETTFRGLPCREIYFSISRSTDNG